MTNYNELSDFEINKRVAELLGFRIPPKKDLKSGFFRVKKNTIEAITDYEGTRSKFIVSDYCNSWADAGPLLLTMIEEGCNITINKNGVTAKGVTYGEAATATRGISEAFLSTRES